MNNGALLGAKDGTASTKAWKKEHCLGTKTASPTASKHWLPAGFSELYHSGCTAPLVLNNPGLAE
jgi:hypothetical protein